MPIEDHPGRVIGFLLDQLHRTPAPDVDALCLVTRYASRNAAFGPIDSLLSKGRRTWFISASNKTLATVPFPAGMIGRS